MYLLVDAWCLNLTLCMSVCVCASLGVDLPPSCLPDLWPQPCPLGNFWPVRSEPSAAGRCWAVCLPAPQGIARCSSAPHWPLALHPLQGRPPARSPTPQTGTLPLTRSSWPEPAEEPRPALVMLSGLREMKKDVEGLFCAWKGAIRWIWPGIEGSSIRRPGLHVSEAYVSPSAI